MRLLYSLLSALLFVASLSAQVKDIISDATLRSVHFIDKNEGWAVGDEGLILHTIDAGKTWERQTSTVSVTRTSLRSVAFADPFKGMAVGFDVLPFGRGTTAVVLLTTDGGLTWKRQEVAGVPGLRDVVYTSAGSWLVVGDSLAVQNGAALESSDDGLTWSPIHSHLPAASFVSAAVSKEGRIVVASSAGKVGVSQGDTIVEQPWESKSPANIACLRLQDRNGWAVGSNGFLAHSQGTSGASWTCVPTNLSCEKQLDLTAVSFQNSHVWAVGNPGSAVLHSADQGKTWKLQSTQQSLPLYGVTFVDDKLGWAVGAMGTILHTSDGGQSWKLQQRAGHRIACLMLVDQSHLVPASTITLLAADLGFYTSLLELGQQPCERDATATLASSRMLLGARKLGGVSGESWKTLSREDQLEKLVRMIRSQKPSIIVCGEGGDYSLEIGKEAFRKAATKEAYPEHITALGLEPWSCEYLWKVENRLGRTHCKFTLDVMQPGILNTPQRLAWDGWSTLCQHFTKPTARECFALVMTKDRTIDPLENLALVLNPFRTSLFGQLTLGYGGTTRRDKPEWNKELATRFEDLSKAERARRILMADANTRMNSEEEQKHYFKLLDKTFWIFTPQAQATEVLSRATHFAEQGNFGMARECYLMFLDKYWADPRAAEVTRNMLLLNGSGEVARRHTLNPLPPFAEYRYEVDKDLAPNNAVGLQNRKTVIQKRWFELHQYHDGALAAGELLNLYESTHLRDPAVQLALAANKRIKNKPEEAALAYSRLASVWSPGPWLDAAQMELWLTTREGPSPKRTITAAFLPRTLQEAVEAGQFNAPRTSKSIANMTKLPSIPLLSHGKETPKTTFNFAYDDRNLFIQVHCQDALRPDESLRFTLDVDRDYCTYYTFECDGKGKTSQRCANAPWSCNWTAKTERTGNSSSTLFTIPLVELTGELRLAKEAWAFQLARVAPGQTVECFSGTQLRPEEMGVLLFQNHGLQQTGGTGDK